jgi:precorrin-2 dehydrogenase/sirohydrochlorin ferrochelatase
MQVFYPAFLNLKDKTCVVIGGGKVAARKVASLLQCGARVRVVSPELVPELQALAAEGRIEYLAGRYEGDTLSNAFLVVGATNSPAVNSRVAADCAAMNRLVNIVDEPELCNFIVPATVQRGALNIAVSTGGNAPALASRIRLQLEEQFSPAYTELLQVLGEARQRILEEVADPAKRKKIFTTLAAAELLDVLNAGGRPALEARINEIIALKEDANARDSSGHP